MVEKDDNPRPLESRRGDALFLWRPEVTEAGFVRQHGSQLHGAVLLARHLVRRADDRQGSDLGRAAREMKCPHLHDPDTAILAWHQGSDDKRFGRAATMACAKLVELPLDPASLGSDEALEEFVRATLSTQVGVIDPAAPYFRFETIDDPWLELNLRSAEVARRVSGHRRLTIFISTTLAGLESGVLAMAAARYRQALPGGGLVFLGVAGLD